MGKLDTYLNIAKEHWKQLVAQPDQLKALLSESKHIYGDLVGIDFDASSITIVKLSNAMGKIRVLKADQIELQPSIVGDDMILNAPAFISALKQGLQKISLNAKKAAIAIPGSKVIIRQLKLDKFISEAEAENIAWQEARKAFPGLVKNLMLDFSLVENNRLNMPATQVLILVIARQEDVAPRIDALKQAGLITKVVDVDYYAIARTYPLFEAQLPKEHAEQHVAIIHFDPQSLISVVMHERRLIYVNRQTFTGNILNASPEETAYIITQFNRLLQLFYAEFNEQSIDHIVLTGRCALLPGLLDELIKTLNIPTIIGNPLQLGPAFVLSCGLAMRGMSSWK